MPPPKKSRLEDSDLWKAMMHDIVSLTPEDIDEVLESTARYGTPTPGLPFGETRGPPWKYFDRTGLPPPLVRSAYQKLWDDWVSPVRTPYTLYPWGHPEDAQKRQEWMRKAYLPGEDPGRGSASVGTWSRDLEAVMDRVDDAFERRRGESMLGAPWWINEGMTYTDEYKFGSPEVEELNYSQIHALLDVLKEGTSYGRRRGTLGRRPEVRVRRHERRAG